MENTIKHIGVLTSGGDAPGMNAAVRAVVRMAIHSGLNVTGIYHGYNGLIEDEMETLNLRSVARIISLGGTVLKSSRCEVFRTVEGRERAYENLHKRGIDALVVVGGDGSMRGAQKLMEEHGIAVVGIPGTIDNDIFGTDFTIGFDTALNVAVDCVDKIRDTATSHDRLFLVEVMGRDSGHIALHTAVASGAIAVLMPEAPTTIEALEQRLKELKARQKGSSIVIVAEGNPSGNAYEIAGHITTNLPEYEVRVTVLGHLQRGGSPSARDRILAAELGAHAIKALLDGKTGIMVGMIENKLAETPIEMAVNQRAGFNAALHQIGQILSR